MVRLTIKEVADRLRVNRTTVYRLVSARLVRVERIGPGGRTIRIREEDLDEYLSRSASSIVDVQKPLPVASRQRIKLKHLAD